MYFANPASSVAGWAFKKRWVEEEIGDLYGEKAFQKRPEAENRKAELTKYGSTAFSENFLSSHKDHRDRYDFAWQDSPQYDFAQSQDSS